MQALLPALLIGFFGSFHCLGMCGPIALAVAAPRNTIGSRFGGSVIYNAGRIITYAAFGILFGSLGKGFVIAGWQQFLSISLGVIILIGLILPHRAFRSFSLTNVSAIFLSKVKTRFNALLQTRSYSSLFLLGTLNGLLPCGLVYIAVAGAIATGDVFKGSIFMALFGLGTLPVMLFAPMASKLITLNTRNKMRNVVPAFTVFVACVLILRGLNLGVPYISPKLDKHDCTKHSCCHSPNKF